MKRLGLFLILFIVLAASVFFSACYMKKESPVLKFSGTLELTDHSLGAKVAGRISSLVVDEGTIVQKGQLIATLDRYDQAKRDYDRVENLFKQGGATQQELEYASLNLDDQQVISPVDGVVLVKVDRKSVV